MAAKLAAAEAEIVRLREGLKALSAWCDERREAPDVTTLGMVQAQIAALLERECWPGTVDPADVQAGDWVRWEHDGEFGMDEVQIATTSKVFTGWEWIPLDAIKEVRRG